jgi:hypothetical protein
MHSSPTAILIKDHDKVKELFDLFEKPESSVEKGKLIATH